MLELNKLYERDNGSKFCVVDISEKHVYTVDFAFTGKEEIELDYSTLKAFKKDDVESGYIDYEIRDIKKD